MVMHGLSEALHHIFETHFIDELKLFETQEQRVAFAERLGFSEEYLPAVANLAVDVLDESMTGRAMWEFLKTKVASLPQEWMRRRIDDMMLTYVWPRIDAGVSRHLNHLLKAPFVAHPKTGRVAVPVNAVDYFRFKPGDAPRRDTIHDAQPFAEQLQLPTNGFRLRTVGKQEFRLVDFSNPPPHDFKVKEHDFKVKEHLS